MSLTDLTVAAEQATRRARLVESLLLDGVVEQAAAERKRADPKAEPPVAVVWTQDGPPGGALIGGRPVSGRAGQLQLLASGVAAVLKDSGYIEIREPLTLPAWQRPEIAAECEDRLAQGRV